MKFAFNALVATTLAFGLAVSAHAAKEKFVRTKPHVNVGTIGHVNGSKTTESETSTQKKSTSTEQSGRPQPGVRNEDTQSPSNQRKNIQD